MAATTQVGSIQEQNPYLGLGNLWEQTVTIFNPETAKMEDVAFYEALEKTVKRIPKLIEELNTEYKNINGKLGVKADEQVSKKTTNYSVEVSFIDGFINTVEEICKKYIEILKTKPKEEPNKYTGHEALHERRLTIMRNIQNKEFLPFTKGTVHNAINYYLTIYERDGVKLGWKKFLWYGLTGAPAPAPRQTTTP